jgi:hypothetical protein
MSTMVHLLLMLRDSFSVVYHSFVYEEMIQLSKIFHILNTGVFLISIVQFVLVGQVLCKGANVAVKTTIYD